MPHNTREPTVLSRVSCRPAIEHPTAECYVDVAPVYTGTFWTDTLARFHRVRPQHKTQHTRHNTNNTQQQHTETEKEDGERRQRKRETRDEERRKRRREKTKEKKREDERKEKRRRKTREKTRRKTRDKTRPLNVKSGWKFKQTRVNGARIYDSLKVTSPECESNGNSNKRE